MNKNFMISSTISMIITALILGSCGGGGSQNEIVTVIPLVEILPTTITLLLPHNAPQTFIVSNTGPQASNLNYLVADDGVLGGYLDIQNAGGDLLGGTSATVTVSVKPGFVSTGLGSLVGTTLVLHVYTPNAANHVQIPVNVHIGENYSISGTVRTSTGSGQPGAQIALRGDVVRDTVTDADGFYQFAHVANGSYSVLAATKWQPNDYDFYNRDVTLSGADITGLDFTSPLPVLYGAYEITSTGQVIGTGSCQNDPDWNYSWNDTSTPYGFNGPGTVGMGGPAGVYWVFGGMPMSVIEDFHKMAFMNYSCTGTSSLQIHDAGYWSWANTCTVTNPGCWPGTVVYTFTDNARWLYP